MICPYVFTILQDRNIKGRANKSFEKWRSFHKEKIKIGLSFENECYTQVQNIFSSYDVKES